MTDADDLKHTETRPTALPMVSDASSCSIPRPAAAADLFTSAKTPAPVPARHPALREALVQASLDPAVRSIVHVASANVGSAQVDLDAIVLARDDGSFVLDVVPARADPRSRSRRPCADRAARPGPSAARRNGGGSEVGAPPLECLPVWAHKDWQVSVPLRLRILQALADDGPIELWRLLETIRSDRDPLMGTLALACSDQLELDLTSCPLGPMTLVRSRT